MNNHEVISILESVKEQYSQDPTMRKALRIAIRAVESQTAYCTMAGRPCFAHGTQIAWCLSCPHISEEDRNLVRKAVEGLDPKTWWIPVSERLPKKRQVVLAIGKDSKTWDVGMFQGLSPSGRKHFWWWKKKSVKRVEYWMPKDAIPLPYRKDGE